MIAQRAKLAKRTRARGGAQEDEALGYLRARARP
jgi:hypothetical protein